jgi:hypothetical protein
MTSLVERIVRFRSPCLSLRLKQEKTAHLHQIKTGLLRQQELESLNLELGPRSASFSEFLPKFGVFLDSYSVNLGQTVPTVEF